jgi:hypothetical protein
MATGLTDLGRGGNQRQVTAGALHVLGAGLGGAVLGGAVAALGQLPGLIPVALVLLVVAAVLAGRPSFRQGLGWHRQVERRLTHTVGSSTAYLLWGIELGAAVVTYVPYSALLALAAVALVVEPMLAVALFTVVGLTRGTVAVVAGGRSVDPHETMRLLHSLADPAAILNRGVVLASAVVVATHVL